MATDLTLTPLSQESQTSVQRTLYRHPSDRRLAGVCGGIGDYINVDPVFIRLGWILATIVTGGAGLLVYGLLWLLLPIGTADGGQEKPAVINLSERHIGPAAWILIGVGLLLLLANIGILPDLWQGFWRVVSIAFWPAVLIVVGALLLRRHRGDRSFAQDIKERMPDSETVKQTLKATRQRIPLKRSREDRMLLGVCGGLARTFGIEASIVRLLWALFSIGSLGTGVIIYVLMALILPEDEPMAIEVADVEIL